MGTILYIRLLGMMQKEGNMKINVKAFALASGILWGLGLFALT